MVNKNKSLTKVESYNLTEFEPSKMLNVPSSSIHIQNEISLIQKKLWFELVYHAFPNMGKRERYTINLRKLRELLGWNETTSNDKELKEALKGLNKTNVEWNIFGKDKKNRWQCFSLLSGCEIPENSGVCIFEFSSFLEERFLEMGQEAYVKIDLIISKKFQSKYALAIYCLALDYLIIEKGYSEKKFSIEELRKYLGIKEKEYKLVGHFNDRIIRPSEEEINKTSDVNLEIKPYKEGRKIAGYKFCMSLKEGRAKEYLDTRDNVKQISIFEEIRAVNTKKIEEVKLKKDLIKIENKDIKEFFAEHKISITTNTVQNKLEELKEMFNDRFENYLIFLMNYTKSELKLKNIKNVSGFYVDLLKEDSQLDNYIIYLQNKEIEEEKRRTRIKSLVEIELKKQYEEDYLSKDFNNWIIKNIDLLETKIIDTLTKTTSKGSFLYDLVISRHNNGIIDKTLITDSKESTQISVIKHLKNYKEELEYKPLSFENWKNENIKEEDIKKLEEQLLNK